VFSNEFLEMKNRELDLNKFKNESLVFLKNENSISDDEKIDVFIVSIRKDFHILPYVIQYARKNILHNVQNVYICSNYSEEILKICKENNCIFINEDHVLPLKKSDINYFPCGLDRRGWIFQQLLKLNSDSICENENILILDSDTLFVRPVRFFKEGKFILSCSDEFHVPYRVCYEKIIKKPPKSNFSFVSHYMIFNKKFLSKLKTKMEELGYNDWYKIILNSALTSDISGFSEYELYGNFLEEFYPEKIIKLYWFNKHFSRESFFHKLKRKQFKFRSFVQSVSFHSYL
jgi:hypothetical protein